MLLQSLRKQEQMLIRGAENWPLLLVSYQHRDLAIAEDLRAIWLHTLPALPNEMAASYRAMLSELPPIVVLQFRRRNICGCLGHHHPAGTESRLARKLAEESGTEVGEVDLAWEAIAQWRPQPLFSLAAAVTQPEFGVIHFRAALLAVLLHELDHLAHPDRDERTVRGASNEFYSQVLSELLESAKPS
jgi:hypothetical protein